MRKALSTIITFGLASALWVPSLFAQDNGRSTYWNQQETLFRTLPTSEEDIIMLGNSITDGGEWSEILSNPHIKNRGISGDTTDGILQRLGTVTKGRPAKIFLLIGTNDFSKGLSPQEIASNIEKIICRVRCESPATELYVQSILPVSDLAPGFPDHKKHYLEIPEANQLIRKIAEKHGVTYIDLFSAFVTDDGKMDLKYSNDGLHLLGAGYSLWASLLRPYL